MRLTALGGLVLEPSSFTRPTPLLLLSYLAVEGAKDRRHLAELFWQEGNRLKSLSMALTLLKQGAGNVVETDKSRVWTRLESDVKDLLEALDKSDWETAKACYSGAFLEGLSLNDWGAELEEWVYGTREYLAERVQYALLNLAEDRAKKQDFEQAGRLAEKAYKLPGLGGNELATLKRLYPLLCAANSLLAPVVRKEAESYDLKLSLSTTEAKNQFLAVNKPTSSPLIPLHNTSFVGRSQELKNLKSFLSSSDKLLLSILGPGGVGKTRLVLHLAHELQKPGVFQGRIYFVSLEALNDGNLLFSEVAKQLKLTSQNKNEPFEQVCDFLAEQPCLLVLDNFEQLSSHAVLLSELLARCAELKLLVTSRETLGLQEEHVFRLEGLSYPHQTSEDMYWEAVQLFYQRAKQTNVRFNLDTHLPQVIRICQLVEGLPLGLELAAIWLKIMSCAEIASEIEANLEFLTSPSKNVPERHRSLRAVFESSWQRLSTKEQEVLRKLSVFRGGFRREAATELTNTTISILASLVDKSLLRVLEHGRYDRHPLLYQLTQEKLSAHPVEQSQVKNRHALFYIAFAQDVAPRLHGQEQVRWFSRLDEELENLREALNFLEDQRPSDALKLAICLTDYWQVRNLNREVFKRLEKLWQLVDPGLLQTQARLCAAQLSWEHDHDRAKNLYAQALQEAITLDQPSLQIKAHLGLGRDAQLHEGNYELAHTCYYTGLELARHSNDKTQCADALRLMGGLQVETGNYQLAKEYYHQAIQLNRESGNHHSRAKCIISLATVLNYLGDYDQAHQLNTEGLALFRSIGDKYGEGIALLNLGVDAANSGDRQEALRRDQESLDLFRELNHKRMISHLLNNIAGGLQKLSRPKEALKLLEESLAIQRSVGNVSLITQALFIRGQAHYDMGEKAQALLDYERCIDLCRQHNDTWALMRVLNELAILHLDHENFGLAEIAFKESLTLAQAAGDKRTIEKAQKNQERWLIATTRPPP